MKIEAKLLQIQSRLKAPKNQYNKFGGYNYRSLEDIIEAVKPILADTKTALTISDDVVMIGNRVYVKATATLHDIESGETISNSAYARECESKKGMDDAQVTGSSSTYARKYCLNGLFAIDDSKIEAVVDPDSQDNGRKAKESGKAEDQQIAEGQGIESLITVSEANNLREVCKQKDINMDKLLAKCGVETPEALTSEKYAHIMWSIKEAKK